MKSRAEVDRPRSFSDFLTNAMRAEIETADFRVECRTAAEVATLGLVLAAEAGLERDEADPETRVEPASAER